MPQLPQNICLFNVARNDSEYIGILNFVYEKGSGTTTNFVVQSVFRIHLVTSGDGSVDTPYKHVDLQVGDVFVTFPSTEYRINDSDNLEYMYISFVGVRANRLLERIGINKHDFLRKPSVQLQKMWFDCIAATNENNVNLIAEGILLTTLGVLCVKRDDTMLSQTGMNILALKKQAEENFTDPSFNLQAACKEVYYNPKYASSAFKRYMGVGFNDYLLSLRVNNATRLIEGGMTTVRQIAELSGFADPLYFSRVYKKRTGVSPSVAVSVRRELNLQEAQQTRTPSSSENNEI